MCYVINYYFFIYNKTKSILIELNYFRYIFDRYTRDDFTILCIIKLWVFRFVLDKIDFQKLTILNMKKSELFKNPKAYF